MSRVESEFFTLIPSDEEMRIAGHRFTFMSVADANGEVIDSADVFELGSGILLDMMDGKIRVFPAKDYERVRYKRVGMRGFRGAI